MKTKALSLHLYDLGMSQEPVENGRGRRYVAKKLAPILGWSICSNQGRSGFVTAYEDLQEIFRGTGAKLLHAEVLEDQKIDARKLIDEVAPLPCGFSFGEILSQIEDTPNDGSMAGPDGADCDGDGNVGFSDAGRSDQQDSLMRGDETSCGQFNEFPAGYLGIKRKIEVREFLDLDNAGLFEAAGKESVGAASELVGDDEFEELEVIQGCTARLLEANRQRLGNTGKAEVPELGQELRVHRRSSRR